MRDKKRVNGKYRMQADNLVKKGVLIHRRPSGSRAQNYSPLCIASHGIIKSMDAEFCYLSLL
jgi:hypothetical protein